VDEFLKRLSPLTTAQCEQVPWIYIANPYRDSLSIREEGEISGLWASFVERGSSLLFDLRTFQANLNKREVEGKIKAYNDQQKNVVKEIQDAAVELQCTSGKVSFSTFRSKKLTGNLYLAVDAVC